MVVRSSVVLMRNKGLNLVGKHHDAVVCFAAEGTADTLRRVPHCIERQKVVLSNVKLVA